MLDPKLVHLLEQATAAHLKGDPATVQHVYRRMHDEGFGLEAHILIEELNRRSMFIAEVAHLLGEQITINIREVG